MESDFLAFGVSFFLFGFAFRRAAQILKRIFVSRQIPLFPSGKKTDASPVSCWDDIRRAA